MRIGHDLQVRSNGKGAATFSKCGKYRYNLIRRLKEEDQNFMLAKNVCNFLMLNPSTADHEEDDPTIRRCMNFAKDWGYDWLVVTNLFAWRATDPKELLSSCKSIGPQNDFFIRDTAAKADMILAAWGCDGDMIARSDHVIGLLKAHGVPIHVLEVNRGGSPRHPLYLKGDLKPRPYYV